MEENTRPSADKMKYRFHGQPKSKITDSEGKGKFEVHVAVQKVTSWCT